MSELTNDDIARMLEDAHAHSVIIKGVKQTTVTTDALTMVLTELLAARAENTRLKEALQANAMRASGRGITPPCQGANRDE